jgi:hypothetical protein
MDLVKGAVSDQVMGQIGGLLGTDAKKTPSLFETAAGSILGGLMKKGSSSQGAQDIFGAVQKQDDEILDKLGDILGGGDQTDQFQKQGSGILDLITGGGQQSTSMIGTVAKALGLDSGIVGKLLMMAAPVVMGVIGRHVKNKALDAVGLGSLLGSQGPNLSGFMPSSLTNDLGFGNLVGNVGNAAGKAVDSVGNAAGAAVGTVGNVAGSAGRAAGNAADATAKAGGSALKYIIPIGLLALAALFFGPKIYDMMTKSGAALKDGAASAVDGAASAVDGVAGAMPSFEMPSFDGVDFPEGFDIGGVKEQFSGITDGLKGVTMENAGGLKSKIEGLSGAVDTMGFGDLTGPAKTATGGMIGGFIKTLQGAMGGMEGGILDMLKPAIEALIKKLTPFVG